MLFHVCDLDSDLVMLFKLDLNITKMRSICERVQKLWLRNTKTFVLLDAHDLDFDPFFSK